MWRKISPEVAYKWVYAAALALAIPLVIASIGSDSIEYFVARQCGCIKLYNTLRLGVFAVFMMVFIYGFYLQSKLDGSK
jgi:hypothetical protein